MTQKQFRTRRDIINRAAVEFATHFIDTDETDFYGHFIKEEGLDRAEQRGFIAGADWADNNPKSPWISVKDDLPCNHDNLLELNYSIQTHKVLVAYNNGKYYGFARMNKIIGIWEWFDRSDDITHWMPIPKMTKEE